MQLPAELTSDGRNDNPETTPEAPLSSFPLGVACGDVTPWSAMLWTRYAGNPVLYLAVWQMDGSTYTRVLLTEVTPGRGVRAPGRDRSDPGHATPLRVFREERRRVRQPYSPIGRFRSAPAPDALVPRSFGAVACTANGRSMQTLERAGGRTDLDLFCLLGDTTYNDGATQPRQFRGRWAQNLSTLGYRAGARGGEPARDLGRPRGDQRLEPRDHRPDVLASGDRQRSSSTCPSAATRGADRVYRKRPLGPHRRVLRPRQPLRAPALDPQQRDAPVPLARADGLAQDRARGQRRRCSRSSSTRCRSPTSPGCSIVRQRSLGGLPGGSAREILSLRRREARSPACCGSRATSTWPAPVGSRRRARQRRRSRSSPGPGRRSRNPSLITLFGNPQFDYFTGTSNYTAFALDPDHPPRTRRFHDGGDRVIGDRSYSL